MGTTILNKELIAVADMVFGMLTFTDSRGLQEEINSSHIPFTSGQTVEEAINDRYTKSEADLAYATINGDSTQVFNVATATTDTEAVPKLQMDTALALKGDLTLVQQKADVSAVLLIDGSSPALTITLDNQPATKKYVDDKIVSIGAGDMAKAVYDTNNSGTVDTTEGVGLATGTMGLTPYNQVMRQSQSDLLDCNTLETLGIFVGTNAANAPVSGIVVLEQILATSTLRVQRLVAGTGTAYNRYYDVVGDLWSPWRASALVVDYLALAGGTMTGQIKGITPVAIEDLVRKDYADRNDSAIALNTAKPSSLPEGGVGAAITNMISCTQAEYDGLTPIASTLYVIVD